MSLPFGGTDCRCSRDGGGSINMWRRQPMSSYFDAGGAAAVQRHLGQWNPYMGIDLVPVLDDEESTAVYRQILATNS